MIFFYVGKIWNSLSTRLNDHHTLTKIPDHIPLSMHSKYLQLSYKSHWNMCALQNSSPNINHVTHCHLAYQFIFLLHQLHKNRKRMKKLLPKKWRELQIKGTQQLNWYFSTITDVFLNQKRINACEHPVMLCHCYWVFKYIYSSDWERHLWLSKCIS